MGVLIARPGVALGRIAPALLVVVVGNSAMGRRNNVIKPRSGPISPIIRIEAGGSTNWALCVGVARPKRPAKSAADATAPSVSGMWVNPIRPMPTVAPGPAIVRILIGAVHRTAGGRASGQVGTLPKNELGRSKYCHQTPKCQ